MKAALLATTFLAVVTLHSVTSFEFQERRQDYAQAPALRQLIDDVHQVVRRYALGNERRDSRMLRTTIRLLRRTNRCSAFNFQSFVAPTEKRTEASNDRNWIKETRLNELLNTMDSFAVDKRQGGSLESEEEEAQRVIDFVNALFQAYLRCKQECNCLDWPTHTSNTARPKLLL